MDILNKITNAFHILFAKIKQVVVTFKFSILSTFITIFIIYTLAITWLIFYNFSLTLSYTAFNLMEKVSDTLFKTITSEIQRISTLSELSGNLIKNDVLPKNDLLRIMNYTYHLLHQETKLHSSSAIEGVAWSDTQGNFVWSQRQSDNTIRSEIINKTHVPVIATYYHRNAQGKIIKISDSKNPSDLNYDARTHPWYQSAMAFGETSLTAVGQYTESDLFGMSILTPVFSETSKPEGIFEIDIELLFLKHFIENMKVSKNGLVFILNDLSNILAFPHMVPYRGSTLLKINDIPYPWITYSFDEYSRNKKEKFTFNYENNQYLAVYKRIPRPEAKNDLIIGVVAPRDDFLGDLYKTYFIMLFFSFFIFAVGILFVSYLVTMLVKPLKKLILEIIKVKNFDLSGNNQVKSRISEVTAISDTVQAMKVGLRSFQKYVPIALVQQLIQLGEDVHVGGMNKRLVIFFSDIVNFTTLAENEDPEKLSQHLCTYFSELVHIIVQEKGTIDKYIGDSIMAFWGAPVEQEFASSLAATAALNCKKKLNQLNEQWKLDNKPVFLTRIGIHTGNAIVGNIGSENRMNYTAIGDAVNHASRLESANRQYGTQIIVSQAIYEELKDKFYFRYVDQVRLKGRIEVEDLYELLAANRDDIDFDWELYTKNFEAGFLLYQHQKWTEAITIFKKCIINYPEDTIAPLFIQRCEKFISNPPSSAWDGVNNA